MQKRSKTMGENRFKSVAIQDAQEKQIQLVEAEETPQPEPEVEASEPKQKRGKEKKGGKGGKTVMTVLGGNYLVRENLTKQFPFMVFITILLMAIITNTYVAEERSREVAQTTRRLNDLQVEYIQVKSAIMEASKQSVLSKKLKGTGIKETIEPLKRINIDEPTESKEER